MLTSNEIMNLERAARNTNILSADELGILTQTSISLAAGDLLTPNIEATVLSILSKLSTSDSIGYLRDYADSELLDKLIEQTRGVAQAPVEYYLNREAEIGLLARSIPRTHNVNFTQHNGDSSAFFTVSELGNRIEVSFNRAHKFSELIKDVKERDSKSYQLLLDIFHAWAVFELDLHSNKDRERYQVARELWGRKLRDIWS